MHKKVVIIGRPNVGKSTLFNRLTGTRRALMHHVPGTTRDSSEMLVSWNRRSFVLTDTAGWAESDSIFSPAMRRQLERSLAGADLVLFMVDAKEGLHPLDSEVANILRRQKKEVFLVANKVDAAADENRVHEFYRLGWDRIFSLSAVHGRDTETLLDAILASLPEDTPGETVEEHLVKIILVGKPNVGKSSLVNALSGEERSIVHDMPGTTREALDTVFERNGRRFMLIDTPGLHRRKKFTDDMEYLAALSAHHAMERADVAILVIDATIGIGEAEARITQMILENRKACLIVFNKWDIVESRESAVKIMQKHLDEKLPFLWWSKVVFVSAKSGLRLDRLLDEVMAVFGEYARRVNQDELLEVVRRAECRKPLSRRGKVLHIRGVKQVGTMPPAFSFTVNDTELIHFSYRRFLENNIRDKFGLNGTPLSLSFHKEERGKK